MKYTGTVYVLNLGEKHAVLTFRDKEYALKQLSIAIGRPNDQHIPFPSAILLSRHQGQWKTYTPTSKEWSDSEYSDLPGKVIDAAEMESRCGK